jgi:hypothetical protein
MPKTGYVSVAEGWPVPVLLEIRLPLPAAGQQQPRRQPEGY